MLNSSTNFSRGCKVLEVFAFLNHKAQEYNIMTLRDRKLMSIPGDLNCNHVTFKTPVLLIFRISSNAHYRRDKERFLLNNLPSKSGRATGTVNCIN